MAKQITTDNGLLENLRSQMRLATSTEYLPIENLVDRVYRLDCVEFLRQLPNESIDMLFTDEPYGVSSGIITFRERKAMSTVFEWDDVLPAHLRMPWVYEANRILKPGGVLVCCGIGSWNSTFEDVCTDAGLNFRCNDVWLKTNSPTRVRHGGFRSAHEMIWVASKGSLNKRMKKGRQQELLNWTIETECPSCDIQFPVVYSNQYELREEEWAEELWTPMTHLGPSKHHAHRYGHPTSKPDWLAAKYIHMLTGENDVVVDPFMGEGTFVVMARRMGRRWVGNDIEKRWKDLVDKRMGDFQESAI